MILFDIYLSECSKQGIQVVLVYPPEYIEAQHIIQNRKDIISMYQQFSKKYGIPFWLTQAMNLALARITFIILNILNRTGAELLFQEYYNMRIAKLDGLRGIFCLMVVMVHYKDVYLPVWLYNNFLRCEAGLFVDFFFVLSGFVISFNYNKIDSRNLFFDYLKRRWIRLYPLLFFTTTLFLFYFLLTNYVKELIPSVAVYFQNPNQNEHNFIVKYLDSILFLNSTPLLGTSLGMNYPSWSISAEMIVYLIFGVLVLNFRRKFGLAMVCVFLLGLGFCAYSQHFFFTGDYGFIRSYLCFTFGYFAWKLSKLKFTIDAAFELLIIPLLLIIFYVLHHSNQQVRQIIGFALIPLFFGLSILTLIKANGYLSKLLESKPFEFLGKISYSIYLNHALLLILIPKGLFRILKLEQVSSTQLLVLSITLSIIIGYSYLTYILIEKKVGDLLKR